MSPEKRTPQRIKRIAESVIGIPTLPTVVSRMIDLIDNPKTSASSLASLISSDQALTARILKMANSAYYGFPREIFSVDTAIVVMGFNAIKDLGLSLSVYNMVRDAVSLEGFNVTSYWEHSVGCGTASRLLAKRFCPEAAGEAFVAGLLHDIGKVIMNKYLGKEFIEIMERTAKGEELLETEREVLDTDHGEIGSWLTNKWNLPDVITQCAKYHHIPENSDDHKVTAAIVGLSDYICHINNVGNKRSLQEIKPDENTMAIFRDNNIELDDEVIADVSEKLLLELDSNEIYTSFTMSQD